MARNKKTASENADDTWVCRICGKEFPEPKEGKKNGGRRYIAVNVPKIWKPWLDEALAKPEIGRTLERRGFTRSHSGLGSWIIYRFLAENTSFRFEYWWTHPIHATIMDYHLLRQMPIFPKLTGEPKFHLYCSYDDSIDCEHVQFAKTIPEIVERLHKTWTEVQIKGKQSEETMALQEMQRERATVKGKASVEFRDGHFIVEPSKE